MAINKRVFGSDIPIMVKKKLEARQRLAAGFPRDPDKGTEGMDARILGSEYQTRAGEDIEHQNMAFKFGEVVGEDNVNFDGLADLSGRTPFIRMWTAVEVFDAESFTWEIKDREEKLTFEQCQTIMSEDEKWRQSKEAAGEYRDEPKFHAEPNDAGGNDYWLLKKVQATGEQTYASRVYTVGNNNLVQYQTNSPNDGLSNYAQGSSTGGEIPTASEGEHANAELIDLIEKELPGQFKSDNNEYLKPPVGITDCSMETEGALGAIKRTTVSFVVHNFDDFQNIYQKYFLRPGAQIFIDYGWDCIPELYDPRSLIYGQGLNEAQQKIYNDSGIEGLLFSDSRLGDPTDGYIVKSMGDMESTVGFVVDYDVTTRKDGGFDCELEIVSKNKALLGTSFYNDNTSGAIKAHLESGILIEALWTFLDKEDKEQIQAAASSVFQTTDKDTSSFMLEDYLQRVTGETTHAAIDEFIGTGFLPGRDATRTGVFYQRGYLYVSWGKLEDDVLNFHFSQGVDATTGTKKGNTNYEFDSSTSFTNFSADRLDFQVSIAEGVGPIIIYPKYWDVVKSGGAGYKNSSESYSVAKGKCPVEYPRNVLDQTYSRTLYDKGETTGLQQGQEASKRPRIPLREVFIRTDKVIAAFEDNEDGGVLDVIKALLKTVKEESNEVMDWRMSSEPGADWKIRIVDNNYTGFDAEDDGTRELYERLFEFKIGSKDSIVSDFDIKFSMPEGNLGNMIAIQGMTDSQKVFPVGELEDRMATIGSINDDISSDNQKRMYVRYLPKITGYTATSLAEDSKFSEKAFQSRLVDRLMAGEPHYTPSPWKTYKINLTDEFFSDLKTEGDDPDVATSDKEKPKESTLLDSHAKKVEKILNVTEQALGQIHFDTITEFARGLETSKFIATDRSTIMPMKLSLTIQGLASIHVGDCFRIDYLPKAYSGAVYFQIVKVSHEIGSSGWTTSLETQMRVRAATKKDKGKPIAVPSRVLSRKWMKDMLLGEFANTTIKLAENQKGGQATSYGLYNKKEYTNAWGRNVIDRLVVCMENIKPLSPTLFTPNPMTFIDSPDKAGVLKHIRAGYEFRGAVGCDSIRIAQWNAGASKGWDSGGFDGGFGWDSIPGF